MRSGGQYRRGCSLPSDAPVKCCNCADSHPLNYRGCTTFKTSHFEAARQRPERRCVSQKRGCLPSRLVIQYPGCGWRPHSRRNRRFGISCSLYDPGTCRSARDLCDCCCKTPARRSKNKRRRWKPTVVRQTFTQETGSSATTSPPQEQSVSVLEAQDSSSMETPEPEQLDTHTARAPINDPIPRSSGTKPWSPANLQWRPWLT